MQIFAIVVSLAISVVAIALFVKAIRHMIGVIRIGQPAANRTDNPGARTLTLAKETLGHTRMLQWTWVGIGHWFIFVGFGLLFFTLLNAYGQLFDPHFLLPVIGDFFLFEWVTELFTWVMVAAILAFLYYRLTRPKERERGPKGRFYGSTMWQGYFVEAVILGVGLAILALRGAEYAIAQYGEHPEHASAFHFPLTFWLGELMSGMSEGALEVFIWTVAMLKIVISMTWMIVLSQNTTMGVAWHRFTAFFNIWFKRKSDGGTALGGLQPMMSGGKPIDFENIDELDEDTALGVGKIEDFSWKGILDFTSCTECGRCQSQCPAWNTEKPLSPKLLITQLRDHAYAKAPYLMADGADGAGAAASANGSGDGDGVAVLDRPLVGETEGWAWMPEGGAVIDSDVLWSCTSCGACVQQCPVDIEHVDHIVDMRRYQILVESNFPAELNQLFKGLENKGNPWNMSPNARMDWAKDLPFEVKVVGDDIESLDEVEWLFWVGCAGAYEDRAKKTTRAVAELLDMAGVSFGVLGNGETCTGDPARRAGNEFVFQGLAAQNAEVFKETKVKKVVSTCAHCFNTLKNEYSQFGVELEVVHHTQLLNRLVREGKLTPVPAGNGAPTRAITYHDPCYLGRHNQVYSPPRELLNVLPNAEVKEMPRNSERSFCCGAGGARMWMEEKIGERINLNRTTEAVETGADQIATGCPFCRVMLSDGLTAKQADGSAREEVEVLDVAQLLLASVKRGAEEPVPAGASASSGGSAAGTATALLDRPEAKAAPASTKAEPDAGDVTQTSDTVTETEQVGANAAAGTEKDPEAETSKPIGSGSLFDPAPEAASNTDKPSGGVSLFDTPAYKAAEKADEPAEAEASDPESTEPEPKAETKPSSGGSLFDVAPSEPEPAAKAEPKPEPAAAEPKAETKPTTGGSLFDVAPSEPEPAAKAESKPEPAAAEPKAETKPSSGKSLFDVKAEAEAKDGTKAEDATNAAPAEEKKAAEPEARTEAMAPAAESSATPTPAPEGSISSGGSLFDVAPSEPEPAATAEPEVAAEPTGPEPTEPEPAAKVEPAPEPEPAAEAEPASDTETAPSSSDDEHEPKQAQGINEQKSLFDF